MKLIRRQLLQLAGAAVASLGVSAPSWGVLFAVAFAASLGSIECATAQDAGDGPTVPTAKAPFHLPAFQNDYVTLLNVYIPPGRNTGFHAHTLDMVTVVVEDTEYTAQNLS
jgi:hypothetical protein